jgi:hypothetical protein
MCACSASRRTGVLVVWLACCSSALGAENATTHFWQDRGGGTSHTRCPQPPFLAPRLRALDLKVMYEIGRYVPLVPIVTKADTMSSREAATYRNDVATKLSNPMLPGALRWATCSQANSHSLHHLRLQLSASCLHCMTVQASVTRSTCSSLNVTRWSVRASPTLLQQSRLSWLLLPTRSTRSSMPVGGEGG